MFKPKSIVVVDSVYTPQISEVVTSLKNTELVVVPSLESIVLGDHSACVISTAAELAREQVKNNKFTPVLFLGSEQDIEAVVKKNPDETFDAAVQRALKEYNLFDIANIDEDFEKINEAVDQKHELVSQLEQLPHKRQEELLNRVYDPPRFQTFFHDVRTSYDEYFKNEFLPTFDIELLTYMREWNFCHPSHPFSKVLYQKTAQRVVEYLKQREKGLRKRPILGDSQTGEGGAVRFDLRPVITYGQKRVRVGRLITDDSDGNEHKKIAQQRYLDAKRLLNDREFKTPVIYRPLHLDDFTDGETKSSFLLMEDIEGPTVDKALDIIGDEIASAESSRRTDNKRYGVLRRLRMELVEKYVDDVASWQKHNLKTFVRKPARNKVIQEYIHRISDFPEIFKELAPGLFSEEELAAYITSLKCMELIDDSPHNIVRTRDASLGNAILNFDKNRYDRDGEIVFDMEDVLRNTTNNGYSVDRRKIDNIFYHVDLHYRHGHIFEDLAHIITAHETSFLIKCDEDEGAEKSFLNINDRAVRRLARRFLDGVERKDLANDKTSLYLMFFYRSARKLKLYAKRYIRNAIDELNREEITKAMFDRKRKSFHEKIAHHSRSCYVILNQLRRIIKEENSFTGDIIKRIDTLYSEGRYGYTDKVAQSMQGELQQRDINLMLYAQVTTLALTYNKLKGYLRKNQLQFDDVKKNGAN